MEHIISFWNSYGNSIISAIIMVIIGLVVIRLLNKLLENGLRKSKLNVTVHRFILSTVSVVCYIILAMTILQIFNVPMTTLVATLSVAGLAVSLSIQNSLSNVAGGVTLLFVRPFEVGDYILFDGAEGVVQQINILNTKMLTIDNKTIYVPNGKLSDDKITNYTTSGTRRVDLSISIAYHDNFRQAMTYIRSIIDRNELILQDTDLHAPTVRMADHGESAIVIGVKVWVNSADYWTVRSDLLEEIKEKFDAEGITIPFNQMEVVIKNA